MVFELYTTFIYFSNDWIFLATINYMTQGEDYNMTRICLVHEIEIIMRFLQIKSYHNQKKHQSRLSNFIEKIITLQRSYILVFDEK